LFISSKVMVICGWLRFVSSIRSASYLAMMGDDRYVERAWCGNLLYCAGGIGGCGEVPGLWWIIYWCASWELGVVLW